MSKRDRLGNANAAGSGFIAKDRESKYHIRVSSEKDGYISGPVLDVTGGTYSSSEMPGRQTGSLFRLNGAD
jgi:hypothetical protein